MLQYTTPEVVSLKWSAGNPNFTVLAEKAGLYCPKNNRMYPIVFSAYAISGRMLTAEQIARAFVDSCERSGVEIYWSMPSDQLHALYGLWWDGYKRDWSGEGGAQ